MFPNEFTHIVSEKDKQPHHGQVFRQELKGRLLVVEEHEHGAKEEIIHQPVFYKSIDTVP